ncbi:MAG: hypothetical protein H0U52_07680 [Chloroflexi bacterium]|nr:hypothetical protein [Chloroflexota bacterium]
MDRRVAQGRSQLPSEASSSPFVSFAVGSALVAIALVVYNLSHPFRFYDHFEWQALAFLEGQTAIRYPVGRSGASFGNSFFQDVLPVVTSDGVARGVVPFPPLPAIVLMPFVAIWGLAANGQLVFAILGAIDVGIAWWMLGRLPIRIRVRVAATVFFGFGTVFWYAAQIGTTWYQAHVLAVGLALAAIGVALGADRTSALREDDLDDVGPGDPAAEPARSARGTALAELGVPAGLIPDRRQLLAGFLFGLACTSRLTIVFAAPFFLLVGGGGSWLRRGSSAALGAGIPVALLAVYNLVSTGHVFHPGYQHLYELEAMFYPALNYNLDWLIEDPRYLPQNLGIMLLNTPVWMPTEVPSALGLGDPLCVNPNDVRGLFNPSCPLVLPRDTGMSILLTSPAFLLAIPALRWGYGLSRLVTGSALAVLIVAVVNLMHFSQGWVQFGYRFSNDFVPWALLLVAIGLERVAAGRRRSRDGTEPAERRRIRWPGAAGFGVAAAVALVVSSVAVNLWGTIWGGALGW